MQAREIRVTSDGSHTIYVPALDESYHSTHGAIRESQHVFIDSGIRYFLENNREKDLRIFEVGFGTGLNAVLSAILAEELDTSIYYESIEANPISDDEVKALNYPQLLDSENATQLFQEIHNCAWQRTIPISNKFSIRKVQGTIQEYQKEQSFHICFFDAFAPSKQPEMWQMNILTKVRDLLAPGSIFVTYCAKGQLKRDLKELGFEVQSIPGPPGKKEMVRGIKN